MINRYYIILFLKKTLRGKSNISGVSACPMAPEDLKGKLRVGLVMKQSNRFQIHIFVFSDFFLYETLI